MHLVIHPAFDMCVSVETHPEMMDLGWAKLGRWLPIEDRTGTMRVGDK